MNDSYGQLSLGHSFRAEWAKRLVLSRIAEFYNSRPQDDIVREKLPELGAVEPGKLPTLPDTKPDREADPTGYKVCIIGAGAAGLFTAMTIDYLNEMVPDLNFSYESIGAGLDTPIYQSVCVFTLPTTSTILRGRRYCSAPICGAKMRSGSVP